MAATPIPIVTVANLGADFDMGASTPNKINILPATSNRKGKVALSTRAEINADMIAGNDSDAVTPYALSLALTNVKGPKGDKGDVGSQGQAGTGTVIVGNFGVSKTPAQLPASGLIPMDWDAVGSPPAAYQMKVGESLHYTGAPGAGSGLTWATEDVLDFAGSSFGKPWINLGKIQGPQGIQGLQGTAGVQGNPGVAGPLGLPGIAWRGAWLAGSTYGLNDGVSYDGTSYVCIAAVSHGSIPPSADWNLMAQKGATGSAGPMSYRNRIDNGSMQISQDRGNNITGVTNRTVYPADRFLVTTSNQAALVMATQRWQKTTPSGATDRIAVQVSAGAGSAPSDYLLIAQFIDNCDCSDFQFGTPQAKQLAARFMFAGPSGTYSVYIKDSILGSSPTRTYLATFTVSAPNAGLDVVYTFIIPGDIAGAWSGKNLIFAITLAAGSDYIGGAGWQAGNKLCTNAQLDGFGRPAVTNFELGDVGLYVSPDGVLPVYEVPEYAVVLRKCYRSYWKMESDIGYRGYTNSAGSIYIKYPSTMRRQPIVDLLSDPAFNLNNFAVWFGNTTECTFEAFHSSQGDAYGYILAGTTFDARG